MRFAPTRIQTSGMFFAPDGLRLEKLTTEIFLLIDQQQFRAQQLRHSSKKTTEVCTSVIGSIAMSVTRLLSAVLTRPFSLTTVIARKHFLRRILCADINALDTAYKQRLAGEKIQGWIDGLVTESC